MLSLHQVLERPLDRLAVGVGLAYLAYSRTCLNNPSWDILEVWSNQRGWDLSIRQSGWKFRVLRFSQLRTSATQ